MKPIVKAANHLWDHVKIWMLLQNRTRDPDVELTSEEKIELMANLVASLIDELEIRSANTVDPCSLWRTMRDALHTRSLK